jgi:hypothetical protein
MTAFEFSLVIKQLGTDYHDSWDHNAAQCDKSDCLICGVLDCPRREPLHYDKDGCPACSERKEPA